jgi:hypothetical protein
MIDEKLRDVTKVMSEKPPQQDSVAPQPLASDSHRFA